MSIDLLILQGKNGLYKGVILVDGVGVPIRQLSTPKDEIKSVRETAVEALKSIGYKPEFDSIKLSSCGKIVDLSEEMITLLDM